jgi:predicted transcriptional regulator
MNINYVFKELDKGRTQQSVADELGVSQPAVNLLIKRYFKSIRFCPHCKKMITKDNLLKNPSEVRDNG